MNTIMHALGAPLDTRDNLLGVFCGKICSLELATAVLCFSRCVAVITTQFFVPSTSPSYPHLLFAAGGENLPLLALHFVSRLPCQQITLRQRSNSKAFLATRWQRELPLAAAERKREELWIPRPQRWEYFASLLLLTSRFRVKQCCRGCVRLYEA